MSNYYDRFYFHIFQSTAKLQLDKTAEPLPFHASRPVEEPDAPIRFLSKLYRVLLAVYKEDLPAANTLLDLAGEDIPIAFAETGAQRTMEAVLLWSWVENIRFP